MQQATSLHAHALLTQNLTARQKAVIDALRFFPDVTNAELAAHMQWPVNRITGRVLPKSIGGRNEPKNLVRLPCKKHDAWHLLFANFTPERIAEEINRLYLDPEYEIVAKKRDS